MLRGQWGAGRARWVWLSCCSFAQRQKALGSVARKHCSGPCGLREVEGSKQWCLGLRHSKGSRGSQLLCLISFSRLLLEAVHSALSCVTVVTGVCCACVYLSLGAGCEFHTPRPWAPPEVFFFYISLCSH